MSKAKAPGSKAVPANALEIALCGSPATATYPPGATFGPRHLVNYEFVWIMEGQVEYRWENRCVEASPGSIVLCRPPATDYFRWDVQRSTRHSYFHFDLLQLPPDWPSPENWPLLRMPVEGDLLHPLFSHLLSIDISRYRQQAHLAAQLLLTAFVHGNSYAGTPPPSPLPDGVQHAMNYVLAAFKDDTAARPTLQQLAAAAFVTPEHLCRLFQETVGISPLKVVRLMRLDQALQVVARTNFSMQEIALRYGFANANHFSRCFKEAYRVTPRQVRLNARSGEALPASPLVRNRVVQFFPGERPKP